MTNAKISTKLRADMSAVLIRRFPHREEACRALAAEFKELIEAKNSAGETTVLGLATGSTPIAFYRELIRLHREENLSFEGVITFNLDEYGGLNREHKESYWHFMQEQLFQHINIDPANIHLPSGIVAEEEIEAHCAEYEQAITAAGGIDYQILGIGRTGHIGFNEPPSSRDSRTRRIDLDEITRLDAAPAFDGIENVPHWAITMGVGTILEARRIALMAWGEPKAAIVQKALEEPVSDRVTASFLQEHPMAQFLLDEAAASKLTQTK